MSCVRVYVFLTTLVVMIMSSAVPTNAQLILPLSSSPALTNPLLGRGNSFTSSGGPSSVMMSSSSSSTTNNNAGSTSSEVFVAYLDGEVINYSSGGSIQTTSNNGILAVNTPLYGTAQAQMNHNFVIVNEGSSLRERPITEQEKSTIRQRQRDFQKTFIPMTSFTMAPIMKPMQPNMMNLGGGSLMNGQGMKISHGMFQTMG